MKRKVGRPKKARGCKKEGNVIKTEPEVEPEKTFPEAEMMDISVGSELDMTMILNPAEVKAELSDLVSNFGSDTDKVDDGERASE